ncbi:MAG: hypothetical protein ABJR05_14965 [Balneola sp.]
MYPSFRYVRLLSSKPPRSLPLHPVDFVSITDLGGLRGELLTKPRTIHNSAASEPVCRWLARQMVDAAILEFLR